MSTEVMTERLTLTVEEAGRLLGLSRLSTYAAVRNGDIPSIRVGRRILVPRVAFEKMLSGPKNSTSETAVQ